MVRLPAHYVLYLHTHVERAHARTEREGRHARRGEALKPARAGPAGEG
jgi:hypothetical protein